MIIIIILIIIIIIIIMIMWRCCGVLEYSLDSHDDSPVSNLTIVMHIYPSARQFIHIATLDPGVYKLTGTR